MEKLLPNTRFTSSLPILGVEKASFADPILVCTNAKNEKQGEVYFSTCTRFQRITLGFGVGHHRVESTFAFSSVNEIVTLLAPSLK